MIENNINELIMAGSYNKAKAVIKKRLLVDPQNHWLLVQLSSIYYEEKNYAESLRIIKKAVKANPECPLTLWHFQRATVYSRKRDRRGSI